MNKPWMMGIDLGGSGVRCLLVNADNGRRVDAAHPWQFTQAPGTFGTGYDLDLDTLWNAVGAASRDALASGNIAADDVAALAVSAMRFSTVVLDKAGSALLATPNLDARAAGESFDIALKWGDELLPDNGSPALPLHTSARLLWMKNQAPDDFEAIATVYGFGEWLTEQLCGVRAIDASQASASGLFKLAQREWHWHLIEEMGLPREAFPSIADSGAELGTLNGAAATHLGLSTATRVAAGGADTQCSLLGAGAVHNGDCVVVAGTTAPVQRVLDAPLVDSTAAMLGAHHVLPARWVLESNSGPMGDSMTTMARILFPDSRQPEAQLLAEAALSEPGAAGMLSTFGAEVMNMGAPSMPMGTITLSHMGCTDDAPRRHLARAVVEGCACALRANLQRVYATSDQAAQPGTTLTLCGGLSRSDSFAQLLANVTGSTVAVPEVWQTSALGAAMCAGVAAGACADLASAAAALGGPQRTFTPCVEAQEQYDQLYATWNRLREGAQNATTPVAIDHLLPKILREPDAAGAAHQHAQAPLNALVSASFGEESLAALRTRINVEYASFRESKRLLTGPDLVAALQGKQIFVTEVDVLDVAALQALPDLRVVAACRGDAVNVDVDACTAFGIPVLFAPGRNAVAVADLALGFMLNLARKLPAASQFLGQEDCNAGNMGKMGQAFSQLQGVELWHKTVGLIGLGAVGRAVAKRLAGFEVEILVADPFVSAEQAALAGCRLVELDALLAQSDFVSLHAAVTRETSGMLGAEQFAAMKPGAFFINTARAALIDEQALVDALESGAIAGAALDTFAVEPPGFDHPLVRNPNVITTPHSAGNTVEVAIHQGELVSNALLQLANGARPSNVLNPAVLEGFSWEQPRRQPTAAELERLAQSSGPAVTDLQRDAKTVKADSAKAAADIAAPAAIVEKMRAILQAFCAGLAGDEAVKTFSADKDVTLQFNAHDLGLAFYFHLNHGAVDSGLGEPAHGAEVQLEMRGEILDGMFTGSIDTMECAMNGEISFMGDAAKAMTLQHMSADMERLYGAARDAVGDPGDLASVPRPGAAGSAPTVIVPGDPREDLVNIMQELYEAQVITATGGNISVRIPDTDDEVWITPSRLFKGDLKPEVLVRINLQGESLDRGARSPSSEWCMHTRVLEVKPEATAVIHAHAPNATILANSGLPFLPISTEAAFFGNIPRIPFTMPGTPELAEAVAEAMQDEWAALLVNHGLIVGGRTLRRAADMVEIIERSAEVILGCYAVGKEPPVLPADAAAHFRRLGDVVA
ncbi:MAG: hypothetical protein Hals2KO_16800 [Halioglobus sp.]